MNYIKFQKSIDIFFALWYYISVLNFYKKGDKKMVGFSFVGSAAVSAIPVLVVVTYGI